MLIDLQLIFIDKKVMPSFSFKKTEVMALLLSSPLQYHSQLSLRSNSLFESGLYRNQIREKFHDAHGFSGAVPRNQSRKGSLKPAILLSFSLHIYLFFEMKKTVFIS